MKAKLIDMDRINAGNHSLDEVLPETKSMARQLAAAQAATPLSAATSLRGDLPNIREYSRLKCEGLS
jgi:hypothetical protein